MNSSKKLRYIIFISIFIFILHSVEEYLTGFYNVDSFFNFVFGDSNIFPSLKINFIVFQVIWWLFLLIILSLSFKNKLSSLFLFLFGLVYIFELHHIIKALVFNIYYPGLITSILFPVLGFFYWRELIINLKIK